VALPAGDVGLSVTRRLYLQVLGVRDGSPAAKAGIQAGDYIRQIDSTPTRDMSAVTGTRMLRGQPSSKVSLTVLRGNVLDPHVFDLVREAASGDPVKTSMVDGVARVKIVSFGPNTATALASAFGQLEKSKTPAAVIDLRGVADGSPEDGVKAARLFVKTGTLAVRQVRRGEPVKTTAAPGDGAIALPVVLLTSFGTSNAAEVFAAALSGNDRAEIVGEPTAGIAAVQKLVKLPRGYGLWLTYERYMTVDGTNPLHERGLQPAVFASNPPVGFDELPPSTDAALAKAVEHAKSKR
jgi:carboxyl-terminal processing protease